MKKYVKSFLIFFLLVCFSTLTVFAAPKISKTKATLEIGKSITLKITGAGKNRITWHSSNTKVATVNKNGKVTAKKAGSSTISAKVAKKTLKCKITVPKKISVSSVKIGTSSAKLSKGAALKLKATVLPANASNKNVKWSTSNKKVATVDSKGNIKAVGKGTATITVKSSENGKKKATCKITVIEMKSVKVTISGAGDKTLYQGRSLNLKASASPSGIVRKFKWTSSNTAVAKVSEAGVVSAVKPGTAKITASAVEGKGSATITMTVKAPVFKVKDIEVACKYKEADRTYKFTTSDFTVKAVYTNGTKKQTAFSISVAPSSKTDINGNGTGSFNITVKAEGITKKVVIPMKPFKVQPAKPAVSKTVSGITAETTMKAASSISEAASAPITVYEKYSDGTKQATKSYKVNAAYNSANRNYVLTVTSSDGKYNATLVIPAKEKTMTSISAVCTLKEIASAAEITKDVMKVTAKYSDGSSAELEAYKVDVSYRPDSKDFMIRVTTSDGKLTSSVYVKAKEAQTRTLTGIDAVCSRTEVKYEEKLSVSDFTVNGIYSDGSSSSIQNFTVDVEYKDGFYNATVKAGGYSKELKVKVSNPPQAETESETPPENVLQSVRCEINPWYVYTGENLAAGQVKVFAVYKDGSEKEVTDFQTVFTPQQEAGSYTFKVSYMNTSSDVTVEIRAKEKKLTGITVNSNVSRIFSDETVTKDMLVVTASYDDGSSNVVTDYDLSVTPASGHKTYATASVLYQGNTCSLQILSLVKTEPETVTFEYSPVSIKIGENIDRSNIKVTAIDYGGNSTSISDFSLDFSPKDAAGAYQFSVSYKGFTQTFDINVEE